MRVAVVMPLADSRGGAEQMLLRLLRANLSGPRVDYRVVFLEVGPMVGEVAEMGYPTVVMPCGQVRQLGRALKVVRRLTRWLRKEQIDVVMSWMTKAHLYAGPAARLAGRPAVWWQHSISDGHWMDRLATRIPASEVYCCSGGAEAAQNRLMPRRNTFVISPAVELSRFDPDRLPSPDEARDALHLPTDRPIIGMVARLQRWKGVHVLIEAAHQLVSSGSDAHFVIVGGEHSLEPDYAEILRKRIDELGLADRVSLVGHQENTPLWMQAMDVCVHASIEPEPFGMVIIEAMALGKPVIAAKAGGPLEIIKDGVSGLLVEPGDSSALSLAICSLLEQPTLAEELGRSARRRAAHFGSERLSSEVAERLAQNVAPKLEACYPSA